MARPARRLRPKNLTNGVGAKDEIRFRLLRVEPPDPTVPRFGGPPDVRPGQAGPLSAYGEWTKKSGYYEMGERQAQGARLRGRLLRQSRQGAQGGTVPLHPPDVRRVPGPPRVRPGFKDFEEDLRRQSAAEGLPLGAPAALRLYEQGRQAAAGHPGHPGRLSSRARSGR